MTILEMDHNIFYSYKYYFKYIYIIYDKKKKYVYTSFNHYIHMKLIV